MRKTGGPVHFIWQLYRLNKKALVSGVLFYNYKELYSILYFVLPHKLLEVPVVNLPEPVHIQRISCYT